MSLSHFEKGDERLSGDKNLGCKVLSCIERRWQSKTIHVTYTKSIIPTILYRDNMLVAMDHALPPTPFKLCNPFLFYHNYNSPWHQTYIWRMCIYLRKTSMNMLMWGLASSWMIETFHLGAYIMVRHYVLLWPSEDCPRSVWMVWMISNPNLAYTGSSSSFRWNYALCSCL